MKQPNKMIVMNVKIRAGSKDTLRKIAKHRKANNLPCGTLSEIVRDALQDWVIHYHPDKISPRK